MRMLSFVVPGEPVPQGGMTAFAKGNRAFVTHKNPKKLADYRARVALAAQEAGGAAVSGPVSLTVTFVLPRPKGHFGTGRNASVLKPSAPTHPTTRPDVDKLERALLDGLIGVAVLDDSQVVQVTKQKVYVAPVHQNPCTEIAIAYLGEQEEVA